MFGIGHWELLLIALCCGFPVVIGAIVGIVLLMGKQPPPQK